MGKEAYELMGMQLTKKFENLNDILADENLKKFVAREVSDLRKSITLRASAPKGYKYKRSVLDTMRENGRLNMAYFIEQYPQIVVKKCSLPSSERTTISKAVENSIQKVLKLYSINN